jgi:uncharacterized lipoprotein NlpE involved in copper resistance
MKPPALTIGVAALVACSAPQQDIAPTADNSRNSLDWAGVYVGTVPCADCEGLRTMIELRSDGTFARSLTYLGKDDRPVADAGSFIWDAAGSRVTLRANVRDAQQYQVGENVLFHLDRGGQRITGDLAAVYRLEKAMNDRQFGPNFGSTMMACPELEREREFLDVLARVDNYALADGTLSLNRARMAPLARFRAAGE